MNLKIVGHTFKKSYKTIEAIEILRQDKFDIILLDVMLPDMDGFEMMNNIRHLHVPVIFITAKGSLSDRITGFELGAEDYIIKPFEVLELLARINVVLRRNKSNSSTFISNEVEVDLSKKEVVKNGRPLDMTIKEFELLEVLIQHRNIALSREKILEFVWGYDYMGDTRTVDVHISRLRKKLDWEEKIKTVFKMGYRLED